MHPQERNISVKRKRSRGKFNIVSTGVDMVDIWVKNSLSSDEAKHATEPSVTRQNQLRIALNSNCGSYFPRGKGYLSFTVLSKDLS